MVPLNDNNPTRRVAYVTYVFIALNILIFLYEAGLGPNLEAFLETWAVIPRALTYSFAGEPTGLPIAPPIDIDYFSILAWWAPPSGREHAVSVDFWQ